MSAGESKVQWYKEQYCLGIRAVRSMNQGQLQVVKQEIARVNTDTVGISKLKGRGMGEFNSDDHRIYYCGQESLRRNGVVLTAKEFECSCCCSVIKLCPTICNPLHYSTAGFPVLHYLPTFAQTHIH